jgi:hypothetical protein
MGNWVLESAKCYEKTPTSELARLTSLGNTIKTYAATGSRGDQTCKVTQDVTQYQLTSGSETSSNDGSTLSVQLSDTDMNKLKASLTLAVSEASTFVSAAALTVADLKGNTLEPLGPLPVCPSPCFGTCK